jgi:hypothetical protein
MFERQITAGCEGGPSADERGDAMETLVLPGPDRPTPVMGGAPATVECQATLLEAALLETALLETELLEAVLLRQIELANSMARTESEPQPTRTHRFGKRQRLGERDGRP